MDSKGQDILFNSEMNQKDLMIQMLSERLDEKDETITELKETINDLKDTIAGLRETLDEFQRKLFGTGSEKTKQDKKTEETVTTIVKSHKRTTRKAKATREDQYGNLPIHKEVIPLPEEDKYCPYCNSKMEYVTEMFVREELRITPAKVERIHYYQEKWQCPECRKDGDGTFAESKIPTALIPHSPASPSMVAYVAMEKIGMAMPYYRQEFLMNQLGFTLPRETMANWIIYTAENYFYLIYDRLHEELLKRDLVHADETTCQVLRERDVRRNRPLICGYIQPEMMVLHQLSFMITSQAGKDPVCRNFWKDSMEWYSVTDIRVTTGLKMSYWSAALHMQDASSLKQSRQPDVKS